MITFASWIAELQRAGSENRPGRRTREASPRRREPTLRGNREYADEMWRAALKVREEAHAKMKQGAPIEESAQSVSWEGQEQMKQMLETSNARCENIIAEAELQLKRAKQAEYEFEFRTAEVDKDFKQAKAVRAEADAYRKKVLKEAQEESLAIRDQARAAAAAECAEMKRRMMYEIQSVFGDVCSIAAVPPTGSNSDVVNMEAGVAICAARSWRSSPGQSRAWSQVNLLRSLP